ncbi:MAG TPA: VanZ family protein, partial [Pontiella sp.]|nr:VanZ family protein [Pontiella sp.]
DEIIDHLSAKVGGLHGFGHFALFASLCFLIYLSAALERQPRTYFFKVAFDMMLFAGITESLQYLTLDRTPDVQDWLVDVYGMAAAFACFLFVLVIFRIRHGTVRD